MVGQISFLCVPGLAHTPAAFAVVAHGIGVCRYNGRAALPGLVLILEMDGNYEQLFRCWWRYMRVPHGKASRVGRIYEALLQYDLQRTGPTRGIAGARIDGCDRGAALAHGWPARAQPGLATGCLLVLIRRSGLRSCPAAETRLRPVISSRSRRRRHLARLRLHLRGGALFS